MANALTTGESTTVKCHSRLGRCDTPASLRPNICTYACSAAFSTTPYSSRTCGSDCWPIAISWLSETRTISRRPVTGFRAQSVTAAAATHTTSSERINFFILLVRCYFNHHGPNSCHPSADCGQRYLRDG